MMKQHVIDLPTLHILMWENGDIIIEHNDENSCEITIGELLFIIQEYQTHLGPIKVKADTSNWRGYYGSAE